MDYLRSCGRFVRELFRDFHHTGAVLPSSRALARAMARFVGKERKAARILEVGPGTGAVTAELVRCLRPGDSFTIVEINPHFAQTIRDRCATEPDFRRVGDQIRIINAPLQEVAGEGCYDFIVSGLPLNNFAPASVRDIFGVFERLLAPGGVLSFFEYTYIRQLKMPFVARSERRRLYRVGRIIESHVNRYRIREDRVLANIPPATVHHLRWIQAGVAQNAT
jgi:phospholipid N-methyltransferase